jgi:hypothetical protein
VHKQAIGGMPTSIDHLNLYMGTLFPHVFFMCLEMLDKIASMLSLSKEDQFESPVLREVDEPTKSQIFSIATLSKTFYAKYSNG